MVAEDAVQFDDVGDDVFRQVDVEINITKLLVVSVQMDLQAVVNILQAVDWL